MTAERQRFTISHELAYVCFNWNGSDQNLDLEKAANEIAGAFLFPKADVIRKLGPKVVSINGDFWVFKRRS